MKMITGGYEVGSDGGGEVDGGSIPFRFLLEEGTREGFGLNKESANV